MNEYHLVRADDHTIRRDLAADLSAYLCGTTFHRSSAGRSIDPSEMATRHRGLSEAPCESGPTLFGGPIWNPARSERDLREQLARALSRPGVHDLVLFGSQARGALTGYSDVDAVLVLDDRVGDNAQLLAQLRPSVLAAQRAVLAYQPMQHHGFVIATPRLLRDASAALGMPREAFGDCVSLKGLETSARFTPIQDPVEAFRRLVRQVAATSSWPTHPWLLHRTLAIVELVPTLYLQSTQRPTPKHMSFAIAAAEFGDEWWPYRRLAQIREGWPRRHRLFLELASRLVGNPWLAVAAWRRLPGRPPREVHDHLTPELLRGIHSIVARMAEAGLC